MRFLKKITKIFKKGSSVQDFANTNQLNRWEKKKNLYPDWDERTIIISQYIPENSSILEFGAARMILKQYLPENCTYTPSDIVSRNGNNSF